MDYNMNVVNNNGFGAKNTHQNIKRETFWLWRRTLLSAHGAGWLNKSSAFCHREEDV